MKAILSIVLFAVPARGAEGRLGAIVDRAVKSVKVLGVEVNKRNTTPETIEGREVAAAPLRPAEVSRALEVGTRFLLARQHKDGGWGVDFMEGHLADNEHIRAAITSYAVEALKLSREPAAARAIEKAEAYIDRYGGVGSAAPSPGFAGQTQRLYALALGLTNAVRREPTEERDELAERYVSEIAKVVGTRGGTDYYPDGFRPAASFQLAMLAEALREAGDAGIPVPDGLLDGLYESLETARDPKTGAFGYYVGLPDRKVEGAASRSLACDVALARGEKVGGRRLVEGLNRFEAARGTIADVVRGARFAYDPGRVSTRKDHHDAARESIAPYYYLFGMYWASEALGDLPPRRAAPYAQSIGRALVDTQRPDGAWLDSFTYGGPAYGTASAMLTLANVAEALRRAEAERQTPTSGARAAANSPAVR